MKIMCQGITSKGRACSRRGKLVEVPMIGIDMWLCATHYHALCDAYDEGTIDDIEDIVKSWKG